MRVSSDYRRRARRLADLRYETAELERRLDSMRSSLESELGGPAPEAAADHAADRSCRARQTAGRHHHGDEPAFFPQAARVRREEEPDPYPDPLSADWRTEELVSHGRHGTYRRRLGLGRKTLIIGAAVVVVLTTILVVVLTAGGASWPASVATVQDEAARACQNPDVKSEPGQVNFACAQATRQILWVFALMTSDDNPNFADGQSGRVGLEPITPAEGGQLAWSLNLHQPYSALNPVDSLEVAARAINSIIGGATVTSATGSPVVQAGLEASPADCVRYTGSAAVTSRQGFPGLCARPVTTPAGQAALVADVFQKWMVGATPQQAENVAILFENANNPGNAQVQAILRQLRDQAP